MRFLEEIQMNALPPLQTVLYDGWVLRFADGYTHRANSINPLYQPLQNVHEKMDQCEIIFKRKKLMPAYKITPLVSPENLDELLESRGYRIINHTSVQTLNLCNLIEPSIDTTIICYDLEEDWLQHYCKFNYVNAENKTILRKMLNNLTPLKFFTSLLVKNEVVACGMAVLEKGFVGLYNITVSEEHRNNGYGTQLILNMIKTGKSHGAENAYLQVMVENLPAYHLYKKLGFKEVYKYHYRILRD
ncbi:MAG: GNAT family N-acetyltransferase [Clostridia bacterium]|nr:GNAT family N-acetyltransferase [Clostridia bacterium]